MKIGVTGSTGFIGWHVRAYARQKSDIEIVPITRTEFADPSLFGRVLASVDVVVHLAGGRFSEDDDADYAANMELTNALFTSLRTNNVRVPLLFMSSRSAVQKNNGYAKSKRDGSVLAQEWGREVGMPVHILVPPNVIGEFAQPDHHTVVATFCRNLVEGKESRVGEGMVELVHAEDVAKEIVSFCMNPMSGEHTLEGVKFSVREVYDLLADFHDSYKRNIVPAFETLMHKRLFNMLYSYWFEALIPRTLTPRTDARGTLVEQVRSLSSGQSFVSTSTPKSIRGEHYHTRKLERFSVVQGEAIIRLRKLFDDRVLEYKVSGTTPTYIDMPTFYTHHIENTGTGELVTSFWTDELYDEQDPDTYPEPVLQP